MTDEQQKKSEQIRRVLRDVFGDQLDEASANKIAEKAARAPVLHQRKPLPR